VRRRTKPSFITLAGEFVMAVIALTSGMGTGVKYVAEQTARRLGVELVYREICPAGQEIPAGTQRAIGSRWEAGLAWLKAAGNADGLAELEDLYRLAQRGNVLICGATALHFLSDVTHVVKIRVRTTMALRVRRIMACMGTDEPELALGKILQSDKRQSDALKQMFGIDDAENPTLYDSVVDTGREPAETCALQIVRLATRPTDIGVPTRWAKFDAMVEQVRRTRAAMNGESRDGGAETNNGAS
jgi:Cytidylate kinase-like family